MSDLIERLRDYGDRMDYEVHHDRIEAADRIEALTADNERLREALEPFRMVAYDYEGTPPYMAVNININLLRAARTALEGK